MKGGGGKKKKVFRFSNDLFQPPDGSVVSVLLTISNKNIKVIHPSSESLSGSQVCWK